MGELLYKKFLEEIEDLPKALLHYGAEGLFDAFEQWLVDNDYLKWNGAEGKYEKWVFDND